MQIKPKFFHTDKPHLTLWELDLTSKLYYRET